MPTLDGKTHVAGVVLAAGSSRRMGHNKLLLEFDGEALVRRTVRVALAAELEPILVVLGHEAARVEAALAGLPFEPIMNRDHAQGMSGSLRLGIANVPESAGAAVVLLADMPHVTATMIRELVARYTQGGAALVVSQYGEVIAPPALYDAGLFADFAPLDGDESGRQVIQKNWDRAAFLSWPEQALADIDRPQDYEKARAMKG